MKLSLNWLQDYIDLPKDVDPARLAHDLTMATVEVEGVDDLSEKFNQMVVGKVVELKPHPNADKLRIAMTDIGGEVKQIVCGGSNLFDGMLVAVALPGARVTWHGEGEVVTLQETSIRDQKSFGMICAAGEIGLEQMFPARDDKEIINLSFLNVSAGTKLVEALELNDVILEIDNKSLTNRPDLWGHYGIARELSAIYRTPLKDLPVKKIEKKIKTDVRIKVKVSDKCCRYIGVVAEEVEIKSSPLWLQSRLFSVGVRPINNIVDLTNYIMLDIGQPMHAFDESRLLDRHIVVRTANVGEVITTLDDEEIILTPDDLVIADKKKPIALAGVMGGVNSGILPNSNTIVIEAANFSAQTVRKTSLTHGIRTESSMRFEKGLDPELARVAMERFCFLLHELLPEAETGRMVDEYVAKPDQVTISVSLEHINSLLGQELDVAEVRRILEALQFEVKEKGGVFTVQVPSHRSTGDVSIPADIVEEVARIYGYDRLNFFPPEVKLTHAVLQPEQILERKVKSYLSGPAAMYEVFNYPWSDRKILKLFNLPTTDMLALGYPPAEENRYLQITLLTNLIQNIQDNVRFFDHFGIFELARVYHKLSLFEPSQDDKLPGQPKMLAGAVVGSDAQSVFLEIKGIIEGLRYTLHLPVFVDVPINSSIFWDDRVSLSIKVKDVTVGRLGLVSRSLSEWLDLAGREAAYFEINFSQFAEHATESSEYTPLPKYPETVYDLAVVFDEKITWQEIVQEIRRSGGELLRRVELFDTYRGDKIQPGKKSMAFTVAFSSPTETLQSEKVEKNIQTIVKGLADNLHGQLRT